MDLPVGFAQRDPRAGCFCERFVVVIDYKGKQSRLYSKYLELNLKVVFFFAKPL